MNDTDDEGIGGPKDRDRRPDQRDFTALLDALEDAACDLREATRIDVGIMVASKQCREARAAVVAEHERVWDKRVKAMLERATLAVENKRLTAELAVLKTERDGLLENRAGWFAHHAAELAAAHELIAKQRDDIDAKNINLVAECHRAEGLQRTARVCIQMCEGAENHPSVQETALRTIAVDLRAALEPKP